MDKLIISVSKSENEYTAITRVSQKASALLDDLCKRTNRGKAEIASLLIEWAYDRVELEGEDESV